MKQRIITAFIAAAVFVPLVIIGKLPFLLLIYVMATIGLFELLRMKNLHKLSFRIDSILFVAMDCVITCRIY